MKSHHPFRFIIPCAVAAAVLATTVSVSAQRGGGGRGGFQAWQDATEEQTAARGQLFEETSAQSAKVQEARTALNEAIYAATKDEASIKAKVAALAKAEEELALAQATAFAKVKSKFTSEQIDSLKSGFGGGRGRRGFGGGGRRGGN